MSETIIYDNTTPVAQYTFLPWLSTGMANVISSDGGGRGNITVSFTLRSNQGASANISKDITLLGPGDIMGINQKAIIRAHPQPGSRSFRFNYLPFIEFYEEDLPWRFTPKIRPENFAADQQLAPWLTLIALKEGEFDIHFSTQPLPRVSVKMGSKLPLPDPETLWATAHVQLNHSLNATEEAEVQREIQELLAEQPDLGISRILCTRQLERDTEYNLFLVPVFLAGVLAGTGESDQAIKDAGNQWAWNTDDTDDKWLPFYYHWTFKTSDEEDFEALVRKIVPADDGALALNSLNIEAMNHELTDDTAMATKVVQMETALMLVGQDADDWPQAGDKVIRNQLKDSINDSVLPEETTPASGAPFEQDPEIGAPPFYGRWHAAAEEVTAKPWLEDLNLHPGRRAIAGVAAEVVRRKQEELMEEAWEQLGAIREANRRINQAKMAQAVNEKWQKKHLRSRGGGDALSRGEALLSLTSNLHRRLGLEETVDGVPTRETISRRVHRSWLTSAGVNTGLKKMLRPNGRLARQVRKKTNIGIELEDQLVRKLKNEGSPVTASVAKPTAYQHSTVTNVGEVNVSNLADIKIDYGYTPYEESTASALIGYQEKKETSTGEERPEIDLAQLGQAIEEALRPRKVFFGQANRQIKLMVDSDLAISSFQEDQFDIIMAAPKLGRPGIYYLQQLQPDLLLPGYRDLEDNSVQALQTHQRFVEAFLAGLNHEMARELLWREFPTDQRGTYFDQFWDKSDYIPTGTDPPPREDIQAVHQWNSDLGNHSKEGDGNFLAFAIRAEVLRLYPDLVIYAQKAIRPDPGALREPDFNGNDVVQDKLQFPLFRIQIQDILVVCFNFTLDEGRGNDDTNITDPEEQGWYLVFSERPGEPQFGLDANSGGTSMESWSDLHWQLADIKDSATGYLNFNAEISVAGSPRHWNKDAAQLAWILMQQPVRAFRHISHFYPKP
jgi:hypothetical protein